MAIVQEYFDLCKKYTQDYGENTIVLMQVGSFMECYGNMDKNTDEITGSNIQELSRICDLSVVEKNPSTSKKTVVMAGFKDVMIEKYIKKIQEHGFTIVVYMQEQDITSKNFVRKLAGIFSPGTYFSNETTRLTNNVTCVWIDLVNNHLLVKGKHVVVGISNIDIYTGKTSIFQFKEMYLNNPTTYDELERFISIYQPCEVILISNLPIKEIDSIIQYANITCKTIHKVNLSLEKESSCDSDLGKSIFIDRAKQCEKQTYQTEILNKFYNSEKKNTEVFFQNFYENHMACQSFCFLLDFIYQHNPYLVNKISEPIFENCTDRLILANHSLKQLNILEDVDSGYNGKYSSVIKMLNLCLTPMGKRKFNDQFLHPTCNTEFLKKEYDITEYILQKYSHYENQWHRPLSEMKDLSKWERQIFLKKITPKAMKQFYKNIDTVNRIYETVIHDEVIKTYITFYEANLLLVKEYGEKIKHFIESNIDLDLASDIDQLQGFETNFMKKGIDALLDQKTENIQESEDQLEAIRNYLSQLIESKESKKESKKTVKSGQVSDYIKIHETEKNNYSLICTNRRCLLLKEQLPSLNQKVVLHYLSSSTQLPKEYEINVSKTQFEFSKQSASNQNISDSQIQQLCKNISITKIELKEIITRAFHKCIQEFGEKFQSSLECIIQFITLVDMLFTKAHIAKKYNYCKPNIVEADKSFVNIKNLRHCLIEHLQTNENYIGNDIILGDGKTDGMLLYGTNAVGKTSFIRALGITVIMAQAGLFVPCNEFTYKPYEYIFTRILGNDNIFKGLSTFAVEMSELRTILRLANSNSLILGDELCSGTEISSAISIFVAGIKRLNNIKCSFIFATHLHEIVDYDEITALKTLSLNHMSVVYNKEKDLLMYDRKLREGSGNNMYGLEVCKSLSLPPDFLEDAYAIRMKYQPESSSILSLKTSHFNSQKIMGICELCKTRMGTEVHHLKYQKDSNDDGIIETEDVLFHKNHLSNLVTVCDQCHTEIHKCKGQYKKFKTNEGYSIESI